jgi:hypothetical protein
MISNKLLSKLFIFATSLVFITSCTNSEFGSSENKGEENYGPVSGLWVGAQTSLEDGEKTAAIVISSDDGEFRFVIGQGPVSHGFIYNHGNEFSGTVRSLDDVGDISGISLEKGKVSGVLDFGEGSYTESSVFDLELDTSYMDGSSLEKISGTYSYTWEGGHTETLTISEDGTITGSNSIGCIYNGFVALINPDFNAYRAEFYVANCDSLNGVYQGLMAISNEWYEDNWLFMSFDRDGFAWSTILQKS